MEAQTRFDEHPGGARNHDLLIVGTAAGGRVLVSVEAKAGETLGPTVAQYRRAAEKREAGGQPTNAPARLDLLQRFVPHHDPRSERVEELRYQLLTAVAGTLAAADGSVNHAVLMLHEFLTDERISRTERDLYRFVTTVFDFEPPGSQALPWCVELPALEPIEGEPMPSLYLAHAITDLRPSSLRLDTVAEHRSRSVAHAPAPRLRASCVSTPHGCSMLPDGTATAAVPRRPLRRGHLGCLDVERA